MKRRTENMKKKRKLSTKYLIGKGKSRYAKKHEYCHRNGLWGFEVQEPKPWK